MMMRAGAFGFNAATSPPLFAFLFGGPVAAGAINNENGARIDREGHKVG
jgi:hypothetical protein